MKQKMDMRKLATALRKKGLSYNEIREHVPVSKSSLSLWLKHVRLSPKHRARLYTKQIQILSRGTPSQVERRKREINLIIETARKDIMLPLSPETYRFLGAALYWAEGSKTRNFEIANSDPVLIAFMTQWFERMFNISTSTLKAYLNIYSQQNETDVKRFWSEITEYQLRTLGKVLSNPPIKDLRKTIYITELLKYVPKGTDMRHKTLAWIQAALQDAVPTIESYRVIALKRLNDHQ